MKVSGVKGASLIKLPEFRLCGWYKAMEASSDGKKDDALLYNFFINPPAGRSLSIKPSKPMEKKGDQAAVKEKEFERTHISYSPFLILLASVILLLDWIYQNNRTFFRKTGPK